MLELKLEDLADDLDKRNENLEKERAVTKEADAAWGQLWEPFGITPQSPTDMENWHDNYKTSAKLSDETRMLEGKVAELEATITRHCSDLIASLTSIGKSAPEWLSLLDLLDHAERIAADAEQAQQLHSIATTAYIEEESLLKRRAKTHERADAAMTAWQDE